MQVKCILVATNEVSDGLTFKWSTSRDTSHIMRVRERERVRLFHKPPKQLQFVTTMIESAERGLRAGADAVF